jgi:hypothetical protein
VCVHGLWPVNEDKTNEVRRGDDEAVAGEDVCGSRMPEEE